MRPPESDGPRDELDTFLDSEPPVAAEEPASESHNFDLAAQKYYRPELSTEVDVEQPAMSAEYAEPEAPADVVADAPLPELPPQPVDTEAIWDDFAPPRRTRGRGSAILLAALMLLGVAAAASLILPADLVAKYSPVSLPWVSPSQPSPVNPEGPARATPAPKPSERRGDRPRGDEDGGTATADTNETAVADPVRSPQVPEAPDLTARSRPSRTQSQKPAEPEPEPEPEPEEEESTEPPPPFDRVAGRNAMAIATGKAAGCRKSDLGEEDARAPLSGQVEVTFSPAGEVTAVRVTGALAGSEVAGCIKSTYETVQVPKFTGEPVTLGRILVLR